MDTEFDKLVEAVLERFHIPGLAVSVVSGSETTSKAYGYAQLDPPVPATTGTLFYACSTTKAQLCAAWTVYIASEANQKKPEADRIRWSTPLASIMRDDFVLADRRTTEITLEDAVSHRTGLPSCDHSYGQEGAATVKEITRNLRNMPIRAPLRAEFEYNNQMYIAASHALELTSGKSVEENLKESLWKPLGMDHTYAGRDNATKGTNERLARLYSWSKPVGTEADKDGANNEEKQLDLSEVSGAGYVITSADDYAKWMKCLIFPKATGVLTDEQVRELWKPRSIKVPTNDGLYNVPFDGIVTYGLGWFITSYRGHSVYWHSGSAPGAGSLVLLVPSLEWGVTFLGNGNFVSPSMMGLAVDLIDSALGVPLAQRDARQRADDVIIKTLRLTEEMTEKAPNKLYPDVPKPMIPLALPVDRYAGIYANLGHGALELKVADSSNGENLLVGALLGNRTFAATCTLKHVSGEHWLLTMTIANSAIRKVLKAESFIGSNGLVEAFGIPMADSMEDLMRFNRS